MTIKLCECDEGCDEDWCCKVADTRVKRYGRIINVCGNCILPEDDILGSINEEDEE